MANVVDTVAIKMVVDASGVQDGISSTRREIAEATRIVNSMRSPLERLEDKEKRLQELFNKGAVDDIPKYERALEALKRQKEALTSVTNKQVVAEVEMSKTSQMMIQKISVLGDMIKYQLIARGVSMVRDAFREVSGGITDAVKRLDEIGDKAAKLGISASALQSLRIQANLSDVSFESLTGGMEKLMIRSADAAMGNMDLQKTFGMLGISMGELQSLTDADRFNRVTQALSGITDRATKLSIISDLFGRGNTEMIMFVDNLSNMEGVLERTKSVMSDRDIAAIGEADTAVKEMMASLEGVFNVAAVSLAPAIADVARDIGKFLSEDVNNSGLVTGLVYLGEILKAMPEEAKGWFDWLKGGVEELLKNTQLGEDLKEMGAEAQRVADIQRRAKDQQERAAIGNQLREAGVDFNFGMSTEELRSLKKEIDDVQKAEERMAEAKRIASEQTERSYLKERDALQEKISLLKYGNEFMEWRKGLNAGYDDGQQAVLQSLREEKAALEAVKFAEEEDIKAKKERLSAAENIRQSLQSAEDAAVGRLERAMDLVTTGELGQGEFDKLLEKEAKSFAKPGQDFKLSASAFGSQAAIAATLGRDQQNDSQRLESIKQSLLELVKKPSIEVAEVGAL